MPSLTQLIEDVRVAHGADLVICYGTSDKQPVQLFATAIATDTIVHIRKILSTRGRKDKIVLAVMTNGGHLEAPWPIISLIREYCDELVFIVLEKAFSAGTLMALGADKIVMTPGSYLGPVDPRMGKNDENGKVIDIEIEDVIGYIDLIKDRIGTDSPEAAKSVIDNLSKQITPTELGSIYRTRALVRMISEKMLNLHKSRLDSTKIKNIVRNLTEELFSHGHMISRREARFDIGFGSVIEDPDTPTAKKIDKLTDKLKDMMEINKVFNPATILGNNQTATVQITRAVVSDGTTTYQYKNKVDIMQNPNDPNQPMVNFQDIGWSS